MARYRGIAAMIVRGQPRNAAGVRMRGMLHVYHDSKKQTFIARSWPKDNGKDSPARAASRLLFKSVISGVSNPNSGQKVSSLKVAEGTPFTWRDVLMSASYGNLFFSIDTDGNLWSGWRVAFGTIQILLDSILNTPGAMLVRAPEGWVALLAGSDGEILTFDATAGIPQWKTLSTDVQAILDQLAPSIGDIARYNGTVWSAVNPDGLYDPLGAASAAQATAEAYAAALVAALVIPTAANPSATAGPAAVNGSSAHYMRADGAPAIRLGNSSQTGLVKPDGSTIVDDGAGMISAVPFAGGQGPGFHPGYVAGRYYGPPISGSPGSGACSPNVIYAMPIYVPVAHTFTKAAFRASSSSAGNYELGLYSNVGGQPSALLYDAGSHTVVTNSTNEVTGLSWALQPGNYWLVIAFSASGNIISTIAIAGTMLSQWFGTTDVNTTSNAPQGAWTYSAGNLPLAFPVITYVNSVLPALMVRS